MTDELNISQGDPTWQPALIPDELPPAPLPAPTADELYQPALDAANAAQAIASKDSLSEGDTVCLGGYIRHLEAMVAKENFWGPQHDIKPFQDAIKAAESLI